MKRRSQILTGMLLVALMAPAAAQNAYPSAEAAADALVTALQGADPAALQPVLGAQWRDFIPTEGVDRADVDAFLAQWKQGHKIVTSSGGLAQLAVGKDDWTLPIPLRQAKDGWHFDAKAGGEQMRVRRIGRNELATIQSMQAYHDAQLDYAETDHNGDGVLEYAQHILSSDGHHDGLYWPDDDSGDVSPLGPLFGDAQPGSDYHGYHYRILTAQGASAPGGAHDYELGARMTRGFALVAWPAKYGDSGVASFMIGPDGEVFEKDLGPQGEKLARAMKSFDPDSSWSEVKADATVAR